MSDLNTEMRKEFERLRLLYTRAQVEALRPAQSADAIKRGGHLRAREGV